MLMTLSSSAFCGTVLTIYQKVQPILCKNTALPVILPPSSVLKAVTGFNHSLSPSNIGFVHSTAYSINFDYTANCQGAPACSIGNFYASKLNKNRPRNDSQSFPLSFEQIQQLKNNKVVTIEHHIPVTITSNHRGYFEKQHATGVGSSLFRTLSWVNHGTLYQLTLKGIRLKNILKIARATLAMTKTK